MALLRDLFLKLSTNATMRNFVVNFPFSAPGDAAFCRRRNAGRSD